MAYGIDTRNLLEQWMPRLECLLSTRNFENRFQVHRVYACATILSQDEAKIAEISNEVSPFSVTQDALDWQREQDEDVDEDCVYHHLLQMSVAPSFPNAVRHVTSALSPTFDAKGRPASTFHRQSFRLCTLDVYNDDMYPGYHVGSTDLEKMDVTTAGKVPSEWWESWLFDDSPQLIWRRAGERCAVLWQVQVDILDMLNLNSTPSRRGRRRYGAFAQIPEGGREESSSSREDPFSQAKRFKGVRYRPQRKSFVAEMKVPRSEPMLSRNKVSFGDFKSSEEAARAIDAAFYHYGIIDKVNFADTTQILSTQPTPHGLNGADKLKFVKQQARMMATFAYNLPSSPSSPNSATAVAAPTVRLESLPESSGCTTYPNLGDSPEPFAEIPSSLSVSSGSAGPADNGNLQQAQAPWGFSMDGMAGSFLSKVWVESSTLELLNDVSGSNHDVNEFCKFGDPGRRVVQVMWNVQNVIAVDDASCAPASCFGQSPDRWDGSELCSTRGASTGFANISPGSAEQRNCDEFQSVSLDVLCRSSPGPNLFQTESPRGFQGDVAEGLLQQQTGLIGYEDAGNDQFDLTML